MNFNSQQSQGGNLNYLVVNYLKNQPAFRDYEKSELITQIENCLDYGIVYNTELIPFPSSYSLRREMFNKLQKKELEGIVDDCLNYNIEENESSIRNENKILKQTANGSLFEMMRRMKVGGIGMGKGKGSGIGAGTGTSEERDRLQRETLKKFQYMKSMLGHISFMDNTFVNPVPIYCVAYAEDDEMIFTADNNGLIKIWSPHTGALIDIFKSHDKPINDFLVLKHYLISCSEDKSVIIWNTRTLQLTKMYNFDESIVRVINYQYIDTKHNKEHSLIIICSLSGKIYFIDLDSAVQKKSAMQMELEEEEDSFPIKFYFDKKIIDKFSLKKIKTMQQSCICANNLHGLLICGYNDGLICVWDIKKILDDSIMNKRFIHDFEKYVLFIDYVHSSNVHIAEFSISNMNFITGSIDGNVLVWKVMEDSLERLRGHVVNNSNSNTNSNNKGFIYEYPIYSIYKVSENADRTRCAVNCSIWTKKSNYVLAVVSSKKRKKALLDSQKANEGVLIPQSQSQPQQQQSQSDNNNHNNTSPNQADIHSNKRSSSLIVYSLIDNKVIKRYNESNGFYCHDECFVLEAHPVFEDVILTISETSDIILFNFLTGDTLCKFKNNNFFFTNATQNVIASEGKFSSKGDSFVISTFLGFISIYSIYSPNSFSSTYMNQFLSREFTPNHNNTAALRPANDKEGSTLTLETIFPSYVNMHNLPQIVNQPYPKLKLKQIDSLRLMLQSKYNLSTNEIEHRFGKDNYENYDKNVNERRIECEKEETAFNQAIQDNMTYRLTEPIELLDLPDEEEDNNNNYNNEDDASYRSENNQDEFIEVDSYNDEKLSGDDQMLVDENRDHFVQPGGGRGNYSLRNRRGNQGSNSNMHRDDNNNNNTNDRIHTRAYDQRLRNRNDENSNSNNNNRNGTGNRLRKRLRLRLRRRSDNNNNNNTASNLNKDKGEGNGGDNNNNNVIDSDIEYEKALHDTTLGRKRRKNQNRIDDSVQSIINNNEGEDNKEEEEDYNSEEGFEDDEYIGTKHKGSKGKKAKDTSLSNTKTELIQKLVKDGQSHQCYLCKFYSQSIFGPFYLDKSNSNTVTSIKPLITDGNDNAIKEIYIDMNCLFNYNDFIIINKSNGTFDILLTIEEIITKGFICFRCNSPYATKKCSSETCQRYFHGNHCLLKMCIDYSNSFETSNSFTQCLSCYRKTFSEEVNVCPTKENGTENCLGLGMGIEMEKVPKNFFLSERLSQSSFFPQKTEIVYFILQGYEVFLKANYEYIIYELPNNTANPSSLYDDVYFWKETSDEMMKRNGNKNMNVKTNGTMIINSSIINYNLPFRCLIENIEYSFLSESSLKLIEKLYGNKNMVEKVKIIIKMTLSVLDDNTNRKIQIVFCENEQPDFLIREKLFKNNKELYLKKINSNDLTVQMFIDNEVSNAIIKTHCNKEDNNAFRESLYENMSIQYCISSTNNLDNSGGDQSEELMDISFWDIYDSTFSIENKALTALCSKITNQITKLMNKNEDNLYMFFDCVDETRDNAKNYYNIVPVPMYLRLIKERLKQGYYLTIESIQFDFELILTNALKYNTEQSIIVNNARILVKRLNDIVNDLIKDNALDALKSNDKNNEQSVKPIQQSQQLLGKKKMRINKELGLDSLGFDEDDLLFNQRSLRKRGANKGNGSDVKVQASISIHTTSSKTDKREVVESEIENVLNEVEVKKRETTKALRSRNRFKTNSH